MLTYLSAFTFLASTLLSQSKETTYFFFFGFIGGWQTSRRCITATYWTGVWSSKKRIDFGVGLYLYGDVGTAVNIILLKL